MPTVVLNFNDLRNKYRFVDGASGWDLNDHIAGSDNVLCDPAAAEIAECLDHRHGTDRRNATGVVPAIGVLGRSISSADRARQDRWPHRADGTGGLQQGPERSRHSADQRRRVHGRRHPARRQGQRYARRQGWRRPDRRRRLAERSAARASWTTDRSNSSTIRAISWTTFSRSRNPDPRSSNPGNITIIRSIVTPADAAGPTAAPASRSTAIRRCSRIRLPSTC